VDTVPPGNLERDAIFTGLEQRAYFPGGEKSWASYLARRLNINRISGGYYTVRAQFIVDKDGRLCNVEAVDVPEECWQCGVEAVKAIKKSPKWNAAMQNGHPVSTQVSQWIVFDVREIN